MNTFLTYGIIFVILFVLESIYFKIADKCNIIDKPSERSSHSTIVLRGGGILFLLGVWVWSAFFGFQYPWFLAAVTLVAGISFIDDIRSLPDSIRLVVQFVAMFLMFYQFGILNWQSWWMILLALIVCVGISNAYNFMDGINGITGGYSIAVLLPLIYLNHKISFIDANFLWVTLLSLLVFCFFNFRKRAKCFAGDGFVEHRLYYCICTWKINLADRGFYLYRIPCFVWSGFGINDQPPHLVA